MQARSLSLALFFLTQVPITATPVDLSYPVGAFESDSGVTLEGQIGWLTHLGYADAGKGFRLPVSLTFSSAPEKPGCLSQGWHLPVLESRAVLTREKMMKVWLPCGKTLYLRRDDKASAHFADVAQQWRGELATDQTFMMSREDGWRLHFSAGGRLTTLRTDTGRTFVWSFTGNQATGITESSQKPVPLLSLVLDTSTGQATALKLVGTGDFQFAYSISKSTSTLASLKRPDGKLDTFTASLPAAEQRGLVITPSGKAAQTFIWNEKDGLVVKADDWNYTVLANAKDPLAKPRLERVSATGEKQVHGTDRATGVTTLTLRDGTVRRIYKVKALGANFDRVRKIEDTPKGAKAPNVVLETDYDTQGRAIREFEAGKPTLYHRFPNAQRKESYTEDGKMWQVTEMDKDGRTTRISKRDGTQEIWDYLPKGILRMTVSKPQEKGKDVLYMQSNRLIARVFPDGKKEGELPNGSIP